MKILDEADIVKKNEKPQGFQAGWFPFSRSNKIQSSMFKFQYYLYAIPSWSFTPSVRPSSQYPHPAERRQNQKHLNFTQRYFLLFLTVWKGSLWRHFQTRGEPTQRFYHAQHPTISLLLSLFNLQCLPQLDDHHDSVITYVYITHGKQWFFFRGNPYNRCMCFFSTPPTKQNVLVELLHTFTADAILNCVYGTPSKYKEDKKNYGPFQLKNAGNSSRLHNGIRRETL